MAGGDALLPASGEPLSLTTEQSAALARITAASGAFHTFLLHGVTGSGKTEVYLQAIALARAAGKGALVLVPEIALTPQLAGRFRARFGEQVALLHSGLSDRERHSEWLRLRRGEARICVGVRSAVFAPVQDLGIVVVDEEHDPSFKQDDGPGYHARDLAVVRARVEGAVCVLGSATPSLESLENARTGKYQRIELPRRIDDRPMPEVGSSTCRASARDTPMPGLLSPVLSDALLVHRPVPDARPSSSSTVAASRRWSSAATAAARSAARTVRSPSPCTPGAASSSATTAAPPSA